MTVLPPDADAPRSWRDVVDTAAGGVLYVEGELATTGDGATGTAFHVGGGWLLTAAHVMADLRDPRIWWEDPADRRADRAVPVTGERILRPECDLALVPTVFDGPVVPFITRHDPRPRRQDEVSILGYPPIAGFTEPTLVSDRTYISAYPSRPDRFGVLSFVMSIRDRPGFSGGPVVLQTGVACGVISVARILDGFAGVVTEFTSAVSYQHVWDLLLEAWREEEGEHATWIREAHAEGITVHEGFDAS